MKSRNFADLLAKWQGGIRPKPGTTVVKEDVSEETIVKVWGYVPVAIVTEEATYLFKKNTSRFLSSSNSFYLILLSSALGLISQRKSSNKGR